MLQDVRFKDKKVLVKYDLNIDLFNDYDFEIYDIIPVRKVYILITDKGNKILKRIEYSIEELEFIYEGLNYIRDNGFKRLFDYEITKHGKIYTSFKNNIYCVMGLIEGRECEFSNPVDIATASKGIGELHNASEGFMNKLKEKNICGSVIESFKRKQQEMKLFKSIAQMHMIKNEFDEIFLENVKYYKNQIVKSINFLENSSYYKLCSEEDKKILCHHDLAHHNILLNNDLAYFVDFDYAVIDLKIHDLCNFINKVGKKSNYSIESWELVLNNYCSNNSLSKKELQVLFGILAFPQDFYNICKNYYTRAKEWDYEMFLNRLIKKVEFKEDKEEFLQKYYELYC